jgi:hypothetical protein
MAQIRIRIRFFLLPIKGPQGIRPWVLNGYKKSHKILCSHIFIIHNDHTYITGDYTKLCLNIICNQSFFINDHVNCLNSRIQIEQLRHDQVDGIFSVLKISLP